MGLAAPTSRAMLCAWVFAFALASPALAQTDGTWDAASPGVWSNSANWLNGDIANGGGIATFDGSALTASGTVEVDLAVTLSQLDLLSSLSLTLAQDAGMTGSLTLDGGAGDAVINAMAATHTLGLDTTLASNLVLNNTSTFNLNGSLSGAHAVTYNDAGFVNINAEQAYTGGSTINGRVGVNASGSLVGTGPITISSTGELRVAQAAGNDAALNAVDVNSITLDGGILRVNTDAPIADYLSSASTGGTIQLGANNTNDLNLSDVDGGVGDGASVLLSSVGSRSFTGALSFDAGATDKTLRLASESGKLFVSTQILAANNIEKVVVEYGTVELNKVNDYAGQTIINGGTLDAWAISLGAADNTDATATIIGPEGRLRITNSGTLANERFIVNGGELASFLSGNGTITLTGDVFINADSTIGVDIADTLVIAGDLIGSDDVTVGGRGILRIGSETSFSGSLAATDGRIDIQTNASIVNASAITLSGDAELRVGEAAGSNAANNSVAAGVVDLQGGRLVITANIDPGAFLNASSTGGSFLLDNETNYNVAGTDVLDFNAIPGGENLRLGAIGTSSIASTVTITPHAATGTLLVGAGSDMPNSNVETLYIEAPVNAGAIEQDGSGTTLIYGGATVSGAVTVKSGRLDFRSAASADSILVDGGELMGMQTITVGGGAIELRSGLIQFFDPAEAFNSGTVITKTSLADARINGLGTAPDVDVVVERGTLRWGNGRDSPAEPIQIMSTTNARAFLNDSVDQGIDLHNSSGFASHGGLALDHGVLHAGDVDLGAIGAIIGLDGQSSSPYSRISGAISGGELRFVGSGRLELRSGSNTYTGETIIGGRSLEYPILSLAGDGAIQSTSAIHIYRGALLLDNDQDENVVDRIGDSTPVYLHSGWLEFNSPDTFGAEERVGPMTFAAGRSTIAIDDNVGTSDVILRSSSLVRQGDSIVQFRGFGVNPGDNARFLLDTAPTLTFGIIGGWAVLEDFATYDATDGVVRLGNRVARPSDINAAPVLSHVALNASSSVTLTADRNPATINIELGGGTTLDLGGHTLTIETGGFYRSGIGVASTVTNGSITAGGSNGMFFWTGENTDVTINASITDNGSAVSSTFSTYGDGPWGDFILQQGNTYTGGTNVFDARVFIQAAGTLPTGGDVTVVEGEIRVDYDSETPIEIGTLHVAGRHSVVSAASATSAAIDADAYLLEYGEISARLAGNGSITKTTLGVFGLSGDNSAYSGDIAVDEGILMAGFFGGNSDESNALGTGTTTVGANGRLVSASLTPLLADIVLNGGELAVAEPNGANAQDFAGQLAVQADSTILTIDGVESSAIAVDVTHAGNITIHDGVGLTVLGLGRFTSVGTVHIGENTTITADEATVTLAGTLVANTTNASINLINANRFTLSGEIQTNTGQSLTVHFDGVAGAIDVEAGQMVAGNGSLGNAIAVSGGGMVAPGASIGMLTALSGVEFGGGGVFEFEFDDIGGTAGAQWDALNVGQTLNLTATEANPFVIRLLALGDMLTEDPTASVHEWKFAQAAQSVTGFNADAFAFDTAGLAGTGWAGSLFEVRLGGGKELILRAIQPVEAVPAPSALSAMALGLFAIVGRRRERLRPHLASRERG